MNVHLLVHLQQCVSDWGPLWSYSCFPFVSANNHLRKLFHGTKDMTQQVYIVGRIRSLDSGSPGHIICPRQFDLNTVQSFRKNNYVSELV